MGCYSKRERISRGAPPHESLVSWTDGVAARCREEQKLGETQVQGRVEEWERSRKEEETLTAACKSTSA